MPAAKKSNSAASSRPRGRPSTKKIVKSSEFIDDEADEAWVIVLFYTHVRFNYWLHNTSRSDDGKTSAPNVSTDPQSVHIVDFGLQPGWSLSVVPVVVLPPKKP
jgi:hypothetical protein